METSGPRNKNIFKMFSILEFKLLLSRRVLLDILKLLFSHCCENYCVSICVMITTEGWASWAQNRLMIPVPQPRSITTLFFREALLLRTTCRYVSVRLLSDNISRWSLCLTKRHQIKHKLCGEFMPKNWRSLNCAGNFCDWQRLLKDEKLQNKLFV